MPTSSQPPAAPDKSLLQRLAGIVNAAVRPLVTSPRWGRFTGRWMTIVTYTGRRSGRTFSLPVAYRRTGETLTIAVELPEQKRWWRNFLDEGGPILLHLNGVDEPGHAVARRDDGGKVTVAVQLG
ncbi:hypothetical protein [Occultella kanbiaonis]|uniref:hypothetical protein n=1 Tax=Occultella kanbiaonis TaxID=2675754 RepID=UPI001A9992FC|nr:hypothetical protein [Occultella kanbiaonis]